MSSQLPASAVPEDEELLELEEELPLELDEELLVEVVEDAALVELAADEAPLLALDEAVDALPPPPLDEADGLPPPEFDEDDEPTVLVEVPSLPPTPAEDELAAAEPLVGPLPLPVEEVDVLVEEAVDEKLTAFPPQAHTVATAARRPAEAA